MQIGIIGLGRMGLNMARRLLRAGHQVAGYNRGRDKLEELAREGGRAGGIWGLEHGYRTMAGGERQGFDSRKGDLFSNRVPAALRAEFGRHAVKRS